jgi:hypothetical protein
MRGYGPGVAAGEAPAATLGPVAGAAGSDARALGMWGAPDSGDSDVPHG